MPRFQNKIVVVTGSSRGIGAAIAAAFDREGAHVIGLARSASELTGLKNYTPIQFDLAAARQPAIEKLVTQIISQHNRIDILINNAGIIRRAPAIDYSESDWNDVLHMNLTAPFLLAQSVARWWIKGAMQQFPDSRLKFVNIASLLSYQGGILVPAYAASKHAIAGLTKALANEWAPHRININAVAPGYVETENTAALRADPTRSQSILSRIPEGRWASPDDIAGACLYFASSDADYVNGAILNVDGGWLAR